MTVRQPGYSCDKAGRRYARLSELKEGDFVEVDGDFNCLTANSIHTVKRADWCPEKTLYLDCGGHLEHYLRGQLLSETDPEQDYLVGVYPIGIQRIRNLAN